MGGVQAQDTVSLREVVTNTEKEGTVLLNQGYRGRFTKILGDPDKPLEPSVDFEFTHAWLDRGGAAEVAQRPQKIVVGIVGPADSDSQAFRAVSSYCRSIPDFQRLSELDKIEEFVKIFGEPKGSNLPWKFDGDIASSTRSWMAFTTQADKALRVVKLTLTVEKSSVGSKIVKRFIQEGFFHATGKPAVLEAPEKKKAAPSGGEKPSN